LSIPTNGFVKQYDVTLPREDTEEESFPSASSDYSTIHEPTDGCTASFSYEMTNGGVNPAELTIDPVSGIFTIVKDYERKSVYDVDILVVTTGGIEEERLTIRDLTVQVVCGDKSTKLTAPTGLKV
jgi:DUF4097 and DUF4098 domain-containing protein YvlB